ncbi:MAG: AAA family ATPase [Saprospiraceae bacterium]|nr:AAA family ATPase [Saprospiraceae bacterium]MCB9354668.1 AAA family ATPase [Lewinellaceae bacterium]
MLTSIQIRNFRLFNILNIGGLGRVNLIAGMNNSGKTALLEALRIWAADGDNTVINATLKERGEFTPSWIESYESLFHPNAKNNALVINNLHIKRHVGSNKEIDNYFVFPTLKVENSPKKVLNPNDSPDFPREGCIFIPFALLPFPLEQLWKKISLTPDEDKVIEVVKQAESRIMDIDVRFDGVRVRLTGYSTPVSMGRLGDGIMQTLKIAIGLVSARNTAKRLLLIDEIESGLHHSVQTLVWEKIFHYAAEWDVQVFATTHSRDAVRTFAEVAGRPENKEQGCYFRLERDDNGRIKAVVYDMQQLATSMEYDLETR